MPAHKPTWTADGLSLPRPAVRLMVEAGESEHSRVENIRTGHHLDWATEVYSRAGKLPERLGIPEFLNYGDLDHHLAHGRPLDPPRSFPI